MATDDSSATCMQRLCDIAVCSICLKTLADPRMLPCIHTFCFRCLEYFAQKTHKKPGLKMPCPLCRQEFTIPDTGLQTLPKNYMMKNLIAETSKLYQINTSSRSNTDASVASVTARCTDCEPFPCDNNCPKENRSRSTSIDCGVTGIGQESGAQEFRTTSSPTNSCEIHRERQLDVYCADCKVVVCVSCLYESHKTHDWKDAKVVEEEFCQIIGRSITKMKRFVAELTRKKDKLESKEAFLQKIELTEKVILAKNERLKALIDRHTVILLESLASLKAEHLKTMQAEEDELEIHQTFLKSFGTYCDELRSSGSVADVCRRKDDVSRRTEQLEREHETFVLRPGHSFEVSFDAFNIVEILRRSNSNIIGNVKGEVVQRNNYLIVSGLGEADGSTVTNDLLQVSLDHPHQVASLQEIPFSMTGGSAAGVYNDTVFVAGIGDNHMEIWKYSLSSAWTKCGSMLQGRLWHCAEFVGKQFFIMGGCSSLPEVKTTIWKSIEAYSLVKGKCEPVGKLKHGVKVAACVAFRDSIFVFGGLTEDERDLDRVQVYNTVTKNVAVLSTRMPRPSRLMRAVVCGQHAVLMGQHTCFLFNIKDETWEERNQFKTGVSYFGLVLQNERIFVFGGCSTIGEGNAWICSDELKYVTVLSAFRDEFAEWKTIAKLPKPALVHAYGVVTTADKNFCLE